MSIFGHIDNRDVNRTAPAKPTRLLQLLIGSLAVICRRWLRTLAIEIFSAAFDADFDDRGAGDDHGVTWNAGSEFTIDHD